MEIKVTKKSKTPEKSPPKVFIRTFGCQMNRHDSERVAGMVRARGWKLTDEEKEADVILLNTCSVRQHAEERVLGKLVEYRRAKRERPLMVGVLGCMAQIRGKELWDRFPELDLVVGPGSFLRLPELLEDALRVGGRNLAVEFDEGDRFFLEPPLRENPFQAWVTVMKGCDNYCSYCVVPYARGREKSRSPESVLEEVEGLASEGYKEVTLLGQNVNSYLGTDRGGQKVDFPGLLSLLHETPGIERIRFVTSHPKDISPSLIAMVAGLPKVCEYLHFPAQSGSDEILQKMNRGYNREGYREKVKILKEKVPEIALSSDFIVGFPGETEENFSRTLELIEEVRFDQVFAFKYSPRPGTKAADFPDDVPPEEKAGRLRRLLELQEKIAREKNRGLLGRVVEVLVEGRNRKRPERGEGRSRGGKIVFFPWKEGEEGKTVEVKIERAGQLSLYGERVCGLTEGG